MASCGQNWSFKWALSGPKTMCVGGLGDRRRAANRRTVRLRCLADRLFIAVRDFSASQPIWAQPEMHFPPNPAASRQTVGRQRYCAAQTLGLKSKINCAAELVGYEIADHAGAKARLAWNNRGAAGLDPFQRQPCLVLAQIPP